MREKSYIMVKGECEGKALEVTHWPDVYGDEYWFTTWLQGYDHRLGWRERFRWCWNILRTGHPWAVDIILTHEDAQKVSDFLNLQLNTDAELKKKSK